MNFHLALLIRAQPPFAVLAFVICWVDSVRRPIWFNYAPAPATICQRLVHWGGYCRQIDVVGEGIVVRLMYHILLGVCTLVLFSGSICRSSNLFLRCRHVSSAVARVFDGGYYLNDRVKRILGY